MPKVYNKHHKDAPADAIYVGRPTKWGNPYTIGKDGDRATVIKRYADRLDAFDPALHAEWVLPLRGRDLVCWCAPLACHADILLAIANDDPKT